MQPFYSVKNETTFLLIKLESIWNHFPENIEAIENDK